MKKTIFEFSEELQEMILEGTSQSNVIQLLEDYFKPKNFEEASRPLMKYLGQNHHPHTSAYITNNRAELLEGQQAFVSDDYILD